MVALAYQLPELEPWLSCEADSIPDGLAFEKELIYVGSFVQSDGVKFEVTEADLTHWAKQIATFNLLGIRIPLPIGHTEDPEAGRGKLISASVRKNKRGLIALFGKVVFRDHEAAKMAKSTDVSIFVPPVWPDGLGNRYSKPITHVALTDYPVIPGLETFQPIVASLDTGKPNMNLRELAKAVDVDLEKEDDDSAIAKKIGAAFKGLQADLASVKKELKASKETEPPKTEPKTEPPAPKAEISAAIVGLVQESRETKVNNLVNAGKITPAVAEDLRTKFCKPETLQLSLNADPTGEADGFNTLFQTLEKNEPILSFDNGGRSPAQLSNGGGLGNRGGNVSPVVANAQKRAEAVK